MKRIDLALYQVDLTRDVQLDTSHNRDNSNWLNMIDLTVAERDQSRNLIAPGRVFCWP